jgi:hypothetical protein
MGDVGAEVLSVRLGLRARWERVNDVVLDAAVGLAGRCRCGEERVNDGEPGRCIGWAACSARATVVPACGCAELLSYARASAA